MIEFDFEVLMILIDKSGQKSKIMDDYERENIIFWV